MNKERSGQGETSNGFWEKLKNENIELGSDNYRAVEAAMTVAREYHHHLLLLETHSSIERELMSLNYKNRINKFKEEIKLREKGLNFLNKFDEICDWMGRDLGGVPTITISIRLGILEHIIDKTNSSSNLV